MNVNDSYGQQASEDHSKNRSHDHLQIANAPQPLRVPIGFAASNRSTPSPPEGAPKMAYEVADLVEMDQALGEFDQTKRYASRLARYRLVRRFRSHSSDTCDTCSKRPRRQYASFPPLHGRNSTTKSWEERHADRETTVLASFNPEEVALCASVFELACAKMRSNDAITQELVGARILDAAEAGERDPYLLLKYALAA